MFVKSLYADEWKNRRDHGVELINPTWEQAMQAILNLDGEHRTMVLLTDKFGSDHYMGVCGQWHGRFMVNSSSNNYDFFSLVDPNGSREKVLRFVGGQDGEFEERKCVPVHWAMEAATHFFETGDLKSTMNWMSDN